MLILKYLQKLIILFYKHSFNELITIALLVDITLLIDRLTIKFSRAIT